MKKIFSILIIIAIVLIIAVVVFESLSKRAPTPTTYLPKGNNFINIVLSQNYNKNSFPENKSLPIITTEPLENITESQVKVIAEKLKIKGEPLSVSDPDLGNVVYISDEDESLTVYTRNNNIKYENITETQLTKGVDNEDYLLDTAQDFVNSIIPETYTKQGHVSTVYFKPGETDDAPLVVPKNEANFVKFNFAPQISQDIPTVAFDTYGSLSSVTMKTNGEISSADITLVGQEKPNLSTYRISSLDEFTKKLSDAKLIAFSDTEIDPKELTSSDLSEIEVTEISLAYLYDGVNKTYLSPIFLLKGFPKQGNIDKSVEATLYLPAIAD